jgi:hypothetical protein
MLLYSDRLMQASGSAHQSCGCPKATVAGYVKLAGNAGYSNAAKYASSKTLRYQHGHHDAGSSVGALRVATTQQLVNSLPRVLPCLHPDLLLHYVNLGHYSEVW